MHQKQCTWIEIMIANVIRWKFQYELRSGLNISFSSLVSYWDGKARTPHHRNMKFQAAETQDEFLSVWNIVQTERNPCLRFQNLSENTKTCSSVLEHLVQQASSHRNASFQRMLAISFNGNAVKKIWSIILERFHKLQPNQDFSGRNALSAFQIARIPRRSAYDQAPIVR